MADDNKEINDGLRDQKEDASVEDLAYDNEAKDETSTVGAKIWQAIKDFQP